MVKTIRANITLDALRGLLTEYARRLPGYTRVENDSFSVLFYNDVVRLELREPYEAECYVCEGKGRGWHFGESGREYDDEPCYYCGGTGKRKEYRSTAVRITEYKKYPLVGQLKVEVSASGRSVEEWKPEVDRVKAFIEGLVGRPCVTVPMSRRQRVQAEMGRLDELLEESLKNRGQM